MVLWSDWLVFCDDGFSLSALWCPLATPTILLGFLLPWTWGISSRLVQQSTAAAPYLGGGVSPHGHPSWPWTWSSSSRPPALVQLPLLGHGVAPLCCRLWPRTWGRSSWSSLALWKTQQWPQDWKRSVFIPIPPKRQSQRMLKLPHNCTHLTC